MPGTRTGGLKAAQTNIKNDPDFYRKIGKIGGKATGPKGFAVDDRSLWDKLIGKPKRASIAGSKGGRISRRRRVAI